MKLFAGEFPLRVFCSSSGSPFVGDRAPRRPPRRLFAGLPTTPMLAPLTLPLGRWNHGNRPDLVPNLFVLVE